jgi:outer membrane protein OmpA-like peptidoglycan-associated protein
MKTRLYIMVPALSAVVFCLATVHAAERETLSFGAAAPSAEKVEGFLFPEAHCENVKYQCLAVRPTTDRSIGVDVKFHTGSAELTPEARAQLEGVGKVLAARGGKLNAGEIVIEGHTDARGSDELNKKLSEKRAEAVVKHLVTVYGVNPSALKPLGRGKDELKDPSRPDSQANRRVELVRRAN